MGTKLDDRCLMKVGPDEPIMILPAFDLLAPDFVRQWAIVAKWKGLAEDRYAEAMALARRMDDWEWTASELPPSIRVFGRDDLPLFPDDMPLFVFRAQDKLVRFFVMQWAVIAHCAGTIDDAEFARAERLAEAMAAWPVQKHPD